MKKTKILFLSFLILILSSCEEPGWRKTFLLHNEDAKLFILNFMEDEIIAELEYADGKSETKIIPEFIPDSNEILETLHFHSLPTYEDEFLSIDKWSKHDSGFDKVLYCQNIIESQLNHICIKDKDGNTMYSSNLDLTNVNPIIEYEVLAMGPIIDNNQKKNFSEGKYLFTERPGNWLSVMLEAKTKPGAIDGQKYDGIMTNIRYYISVGESKKYLQKWDQLKQ